MSIWDRFEIGGLKGRVVQRIETDDPTHPREIDFHMADGAHYRMHHIQDCCEDVVCQEVIGTLDDLLGFPITEAEAVESTDEPSPHKHSESHTWTFYKLGTEKGFVTLRWLGESNGYYSESVDISDMGKGA